MDSITSILGMIRKSSDCISYSQHGDVVKLILSADKLAQWFLDIL